MLGVARGRRARERVQRDRIEIFLAELTVDFFEKGRGNYREIPGDLAADSLEEIVIVASERTSNRPETSSLLWK